MGRHDTQVKKVMSDRLRTLGTDLKIKGQHPSSLMKIIYPSSLTFETNPKA